MADSTGLWMFDYEGLETGIEKCDGSYDPIDSFSIPRSSPWALSPG